MYENSQCGGKNKTMNLTEIIRTLYMEKAKVEDSIAALEALESSGTNGARLPRRRGRKSMGAEERRQVSARMKQYWERWRQTTAAASGAGSN